MDEQTSAEIKILEAEMAELTRERDARLAAVRDFREKEDVAAGVIYSKEIFEAQRDKLRLDVEIQFCKNKINRLKLPD